MKRKFYFNLILAVIFMLGSNTNAFAAPLITSHPVSVAECAGYAGTLSFSVVASGKSLTYQWQSYDASLRKYVNIRDVPSTSATLSYTFTTKYPLPLSLNGLRVRCAVTDYLGTSYSNPAYLYVNNNITSHPASQSKVVGESVTFSVTATGKNLTYQWDRLILSTWKSISGATSSSFTISSVAEQDALQYRCRVYGGCNNLTSNAATLTVYPVLAITKQPANQGECLGDQVSFQISTNITEGLSYQWEYLVYKGTEWVPIPAGSGGTSNPLVIPSTTIEMNRGSFRCTASGAGGQTVTSNAAMLTVYTPATITSHPASATKETGESVTFNVIAGGSSTSRTYQWQADKGSGYANITGATASSLTLSDLTVSDNGSYRCVVKNICNSAGAISNPAVLTVNPPAYPNGWYKQTSGTGQDVLTLHPLSENIAWALTADNDKLLKTTNGGENWNTVNTGYEWKYWKALYFISESIGMVGGRNGIARTTDGGSTWSYIDLKAAFFEVGSTELFDIQNIYFFNNLLGWAVGSKGIICKTTDGGASWTKLNYNGDPYPIDIILYSVFFLSETTGFVAGQNGIMYRTTDGSSWTEITSNTSSTIYDITFVNSSTGYFVSTDYKGFFSTTNGGSTWTKISADMPYIYPYSVVFLDNDNGYVAGMTYIESQQKGIVLKTYDGGTTWVSQAVQNASSINEIRMLDAEHGWFAGKAGNIYRTGKGGCYTPVVSLYEDKTFCSGENYVIQADTFSANVNGVRYLWNPGGDITGTKTVTTTNTYSVTLTNECNVTASDAVTITFRPLPDANAGEDVAICNGEITQLNASGGVSYLWNNAHLLDNDEVSNPVTVPLINTTAFTVSVTDEHGCSKSDNVTVTVKPIPSSAFNAPEFVCGTTPAAISYASSTTGKSFEWDFGEGAIDSAVSVIPEGPYQVSWEATGDKAVSLVVTQDNCVSPVTQKFIQVRTMPSSVFLLPEAVCGSSQVAAEYAGSSDPGAVYAWNFDGGVADPGTGQGPHLVAWVSGGTKTVSLSVTENECLSSTTEREIYAAYPYASSQICMVGVDEETNKNMVVWHHTPDTGIAYYKVYRESAVAGVYDHIGDVQFDEIPVFVDMGTNPKAGQERYKISVVDTCGNESVKSPYHMTMLLSYVPATEYVSMRWDHYKVEGMPEEESYFEKLIIYRGTDSTSMSPLIERSTNTTSYNDTDPVALTTKMYYKIAGVLKSTCDPAGLLGRKASSGPFVHAFSNLEDNQKSSSGIDDPSGDKINLVVYPNPFVDEATLRYTLREPSNVRIEIYNIIGERVSELLQVNNQSPGTYLVPVEASDLNNQNGLYYVKVYVNDAYAIKKMMMVK